MCKAMGRCSALPLARLSMSQPNRPKLCNLLAEVKEEKFNFHFLWFTLLLFPDALKPE